MMDALLPRRALTKMAGRLASAQMGWATQWAIRRFAAHYQVDMSEAAEPELAAYATFNDFFTRALKTQARPLAAADYLSPVDGRISQLGAIEGDQIIQAKKHRYSTWALLGGDRKLAAEFEGGQFATLYLSPRDYHRVHMPCEAQLEQMIYVPGSFFSVNPATAERVPCLFARNERVICLFKTLLGPMALILVGATIVGSMATVWHGVVKSPGHNGVHRFDYKGELPWLQQGQEMGRFLLGSTVIMLWPPNTLHFQSDWASGRSVRMGEAMGRSAHVDGQIREP